MDLWTINPELTGTSPLPHFTSCVHSNKSGQQPVINNEIALQLKSTPDGGLELLQFPTNLHLTSKSKDVVLSNGFPGYNNWLLNWDWRTIQRNIKSWPRTNQTNSTLESLKRRSPDTFSNHGGQWTIGNTHCNDWIAIETGWYYICRTFHRKEQFSQPLVGVSFLQHNGTVLDMI